ncbi:MAG: hypothetical protein LRY40_04505 [Shewanella fodinae]|nr:hypothetical protein [Shewanella fodinae]
MFYPQAHGSINADITVRGDESHPQLLLDGSAAQLSFKDYELQSAQVNGRYTPLDQHAFSLQLQAHALTLSHQQLDSLTLVANGDLNQQQLTLSSQGPQSIGLTLNNRYDHKKKARERSARTTAIKYEYRSLATATSGKFPLGFAKTAGASGTIMLADRS